MHAGRVVGVFRIHLWLPPPIEPPQVPVVVCESQLLPLLLLLLLVSLMLSLLLEMLLLDPSKPLQLIVVVNRVTINA
jgi:hypothetical protein